jgi:hypothetical protein
VKTATAFLKKLPFFVLLNRRIFMKNIYKKSFVLVVAVIMVLLFCSSCAASITTTDVIYSPDGKYSLEMQDVGGKYSMLNKCDAQIILKKDDKIIDTYSFTVRESSSLLKLTAIWKEDCVEVFLFEYSKKPDAVLYYY